jgi:CBS domain-containing protein
MGVFRSVELPTYEDQVYAQIATAKQQAGEVSLRSLFRRGAETWTIEADHAGHVSGTGELEEDLETDSYIAELSADAIEPEGVARVLHMATLADITAQSETIVVGPDTSVKEIIDRMCAGDALGTVIVRDQSNALLGIVTEADVTHRLSASTELDAVRVADIMTPNPELLRSDDSIAVALNFMGERGFRRVTVVDADNEVKVITIDDVLDFIRDN